MSKKPFIARDTGEPLVILGGYRVAEDGGIIRETIDLSRPAGPSPPSAEDLALLDVMGMDGIRKAELFGLLERLEYHQKGR